MSDGKVGVAYEDASHYATRGNACILQNEEAIKAIAATLSAGIHIGQSALTSEELVRQVFRSEFDALNQTIERIKASVAGGMNSFADLDAVTATQMRSHG